MKGSERFVFDTNVILSAALFFDSTPGQAFRLARELGVLLVSPELVRELNDVLSRAKFERYVTRNEREKFLGLLLRETEYVEIVESIAICRDPKDDLLLEIAVNGGASVLVSGDRDLQILNPFRGISILTPAEFLDQFSQVGLE